MSRTGSVKSSGAFSSVGSADSDRCVLAMQTGKWSEAVGGELVDLLLGLGIEVDVGGAVDAASRPSRSCPGSARRPRRACWKLLGCSQASTTALGEVGRADAALGEALVDLGGERAGLERQALDELDLLVGVAGAAVDRDDAGHAELRTMARWRRTFAMPASIAGAPAGAVGARIVVDPAVVLDRAHGRDEHDGARREVAEAADDVEELLHAHVRAEARLGDDVVAELHADQVGDERVVAVGDVRERAAVHQARLALERLDQVRLERVLEQHGHRAGGAEVLGGDRRRRRRRSARR